MSILTIPRTAYYNLWLDTYNRGIARGKSPPEAKRHASELMANAFQIADAVEAHEFEKDIADERLGIGQ